MPQRPRGILVTDFDGTLTRHDFYQLAMAGLIPAGTPNYWQDYLDRRLSHFEVLERLFAAIRAGEASMLATAERCEVDPRLESTLTRLEAAGWQTVIASAGCAWYIERLMAARNLKLRIIANPGTLEPERGLLMTRPVESPYYSAETGIDKAAVVREALQQSDTVAFVGDGRADYEASLLVPAERRFARGMLADLLRQAGAAYHPFDVWSNVAERLLTGA